MIKKLSNLFLLGIVVFTIQSCYLGKKIEQNLVIYIDKSSLITKSISNVQQPIYLNNYTIEQYTETFYNKLLNEVTYQTNITITDDVSKANYTLKLNYFEVVESESRQVVNDAASPYNGQTYYLSEIDTKCNFDILKGTEKIENYTAYADKDEKLKNNQTILQLAVGANKDNTQYREKSLQSDVCNDLAEKCGRRTWNLFTQKLAKKLK
jgi:hypothetical protein